LILGSFDGVVVRPQYWTPDSYPFRTSD